MIELQGIAASPGIAIGQAYLKKEEPIEIREEKIDKSEIEGEIKRFHTALSRASREVKILKEKMAKRLGDEEAAIFKAHMLFLNDPELLAIVEENIRTGQVRAEAAVDLAIKQYLSFFEQIEDEYLGSRAADVRDIGKRILRILRGTQEGIELGQGVIILAWELTPSDTARLDPAKVLGFATGAGSTTSHTAIMARSLRIPAVVGLGEDVFKGVEGGAHVIIDGNRGKVIIYPDKDILESYRYKLEQYGREEEERLVPVTDKKAVTKDGKEIELTGNIGNLEQLEMVLDRGGEGIGLFRTEFMYMDRDTIPSEEEQFKVYKQAAEILGDKPLIIRTLDLGGDKSLPYLDVPDGMNPFLGYRAVRMCNDRKDIFKPQLRAILRASNYGNIKIMYPMITSLEELRKTNYLLKEVQIEMEEMGIEFNRKLEVGIMIETPAAVAIADLLAEETDFFSIGTNDLIQYTLAVDRTNQMIADLYTPFHPAVLRLLKKTVDTGNKKNIWVGICGEAASDERMLPFLLGIGLDRLSMSSLSIPEIKELIGRWSIQEAEKVVEEILKLKTIAEIESFLEELWQEKV